MEAMARFDFARNKPARKTQLRPPPPRYDVAMGKPCAARRLGTVSAHKHRGKDRVASCHLVEPCAEAGGQCLSCAEQLSNRWCRRSRKCPCCQLVYIQAWSRAPINSAAAAFAIKPAAICRLERCNEHARKGSRLPISVTSGLRFRGTHRTF